MLTLFFGFEFSHVTIWPIKGLNCSVYSAGPQNITFCLEKCIVFLLCSFLLVVLLYIILYLHVFVASFLPDFLRQCNVFIFTGGSQIAKTNKYVVWPSVTQPGNANHICQKCIMYTTCSCQIWHKMTNASFGCHWIIDFLIFWSSFATEPVPLLTSF